MSPLQDIPPMLERFAEELRAVVETLPETLAAVPVWQAAMFVPLGLVSLFYGLKLFRGMVVAYAVIAGGLGGRMLAEYLGMPEVVGMIVGGLVLGLAAWPLLKYVAIVLGGCAGAMLAGTVLYSMGHEPHIVLGAGGVGFLTGLVLGALVFRAVIIFMTAVLGSHLIVLGVITLVAAVPDVGAAVLSGLERQRYLLPVLVCVPAVIGAIYQARVAEVEEKKAED